MRFPCTLLLLALLASCAAPGSSGRSGTSQEPVSAPQQAPALQADPTYSRNFNFQIGGRSLDGDVWDDADDQLVWGVALELVDPEIRRGPEFGLMFSDDSQDINNIFVQGETTELFGGYQFRFGESRVFEPYLGFGISLIESELEVFGQGDDDASFGYYFHLGARHAITYNLGLGIDFRTLRGTDIRMHGVSGDADYSELSLTLSLGF